LYLFFVRLGWLEKAGQVGVAILPAGRMAMAGVGTFASGIRS